MNPSTLGIFSGALVGVGVALLVWVLAPRTVRAGEALARIGDITESVTSARTVTTRWDRAGGWVARRVSDIPFLTVPSRDLDLLEITPQAFYASKIRSALIGFAMPLIGAVFFQIMGLPAVLPLAASFLLAGFFWFAPDAGVRRKAAAARAEFTRFVTVYLQMVAVALLGSTTADAALANAASVSDSWVFQKIRREYAVADVTHTSKWDALERLGADVGVPALVDLGRTMRLSEARIGIREQLIAKCEMLRAEISAAEKALVKRQIGLMAGPVVATLVPVFGLVIIPPVIQLVAAF